MGTTIHMLAGIPGSGKSSYAKLLAKEHRAVIVSTDQIRGELFGDEAKQKNTYLVFNRAFAQIDEALMDGRKVIFDATNVDRSRRLQFLKRYQQSKVHCHWFDTPFEVALSRMQARKRRMEEAIVRKYAKNFQLPVAGEGFEQIHIVHEAAAAVQEQLNREQLEQLLQQNIGHDELFNYLSQSPHFARMVNFDQGNPYHSKTLSQHTYAVLEYIRACYIGEDMLMLQIAALFHDIGKPFCKVWKPSRGYYSYYGHEHVSANIACQMLMDMGYEQEFIIRVAEMVDFHMEILHGGDSGANHIYHLLGAEMLSKLYFFAEADTFGK